MIKNSVTHGFSFFKNNFLNITGIFLIYYGVMAVFNTLTQGFMGDSFPTLAVFFVAVFLFPMELACIKYLNNLNNENSLSKSEAIFENYNFDKKFISKILLSIIFIGVPIIVSYINITLQYKVLSLGEGEGVFYSVAFILIIIFQFLFQLFFFLVPFLAVFNEDFKITKIFTRSIYLCKREFLSALFAYFVFEMLSRVLSLIYLLASNFASTFMGSTLSTHYTATVILWILQSIIYGLYFSVMLHLAKYMSGEIAE